MTNEALMALRGDACPKPELLAAYIDDGLLPDERTLVEGHLVHCDDCRDVVSGTVEAVALLPPVRPWRVSPRTVAVAVTTLAAAAALVLMVRLQRPSPYYVPEIAGLVEAVGASRPIEARLTGGFAYGPPPQRTRGSVTSSRPPAITAAAARVAMAAKGDASAPGRAAAGVASLLLGEPAAAVTALEGAAAAQPRDPRILSDLSAAYLVRSATGDASDITRALDAADRATQLADAPLEAWFNRALALEALGGTDRAREGWDTYLRHDPQGPWADEARRRLEQLPRVVGRSGRLDTLESWVYAPTASMSPSAMSMALGAVEI